LYNFCSPSDCADGAGPLGPLVQTANRDFYGTTEGGGAYGGGTVFKISPSGDLTTLYSFCALANCADGEQPNGGLAQGRSGNFYGTTTGGGIPGCSNLDGCGTVFEITPAGKLTTLYNFCASNADCPDGDFPSGELLQASNGQFYGETVAGGAIGCGTVFKISPAGELTTLLSFELDPCGPSGGLIQAANGSLYGVTGDGGSGAGCYGSYGCGTVFEVNSAGKLTTLYNFCSLGGCADGSFPYGPLVQGTDGNFYGTTLTGGVFNPRQGTLFEITPRGTLTTLYSFCRLYDCPDGGAPAAGPMQDTNGTFYGTTAGGGTGNDGTIFSLATGLGPFVSFVRNPAKVGQEFGILGQGLTGTTSVLLNGVPASFTVRADTLLTATVPAGATTGYVTVTTPSGTLTSNVPFHVIP
jgi:uncharacterized repeat protein (TIGR03803 family)